MTVAAKQVPPVNLTIEDCDAELIRYTSQLLGEKDPEMRALCRYEIDRWLDRRLVLMRETLE